MERVAQASLAAVSLLIPAPLRAYERRAGCRLADATTRATTAHIGRFGRTSAGCPRSGGRVPLTLCHRMFRGVFRLGNTPGLPTVTPCEVKTRALVQIFSLVVGKRLLSAVFGSLGGRGRKDRLTVS